MKELRGKAGGAVISMVLEQELKKKQRFYAQAFSA